MSWKLMEVAPTLYGEIDQISYESTLEATPSAPTSDWVMLPNGIEQIIVTFITSASQTFGRIETTSDPVSTVKTGSPTAVPWSNGDVDLTVQASCKPVTAMRLIHVSGAGTVNATMRAQ